ncbi:MAG: creatininase family protein [Planctomycetes bacterium]|nr:creatininase family protein [Planctomycetota bacterium]
MNWEELTDRDFGRAVRETGLCVVPLGVLERHSEHLPLGTDVMVAHFVATMAADREPAVVFPAYYFGQIFEAKHFPGTLAIKPALLLELMENVCEEIGRNGFTKILLYNCHGGNSAMMKFFLQSALSKEKSYTLYHSEWLADSAMEKKVRRICRTKGGHADETETSLMLAIASDMIKMDRVPKTPAKPLGRLKHLKDIQSSIGWYSDYPEHYAGDARAANAAKGQKILEIYVSALAAVIRRIKADQAAPALQSEFFQRIRDISRPRKEKSQIVR